MFEKNKIGLLENNNISVEGEILDGVFLNSSNGIIDELNILEDDIKHIKLIGGKTGGSGWIRRKILSKS